LANSKPKDDHSPLLERGRKAREQRESSKPSVKMRGGERPELPLSSKGEGSTSTAGISVPKK